MNSPLENRKVRLRGLGGPAVCGVPGTRASATGHFPAGTGAGQVEPDVGGDVPSPLSYFRTFVLSYSVTHSRTALMQQHTGNEFAAAWEMIAQGTPSTKIIMATLAVMSVASWTIIALKLIQFRRLHREADQFLDRVQAAERLDEAYTWVRGLKESPFTRLFKRGMGFFTELRPGAAKQGTDVRGLSPAQLEVLKMVLEKEESEERDELARGLSWLAIIATASPLLGLLGTVLGVMNSFLGVAASGSSSITVVAPGVAEALVATGGGLVVAIPAAMSYNYLTARLNRFTGELEGISTELIGALAREGRI
jgi:biopolymer transport protein TolQ